MKFNCGPDPETIQRRLDKEHARWDALEKKNADKIEASRNKELYYRIWHPWFAWHPVSIGDGKCVWFETVYRRFYSTDVNPLYGGLTKWNPRYKTLNG